MRQVPRLYSNLIEVLRGTEYYEGLRPFGMPHVDAIRHTLPGVPDDYMQYLLEVGPGEVGVLTVLDEPMPVADVYGAVAAEHLGSIVVVATWDTGECVGFDVARDWSLVEIDELMKVHDLSRSFGNYVSEEIPSRL